MAPFSTDDHSTAPVTARSPRPLPADAPQLTTAAMARFACLAERCEDTCCRDFTVSIDKPSLERMKETLARTPEGRERLVRLVVIGRPSRHADGPAHLQMGPDGACPMLDEERRCAVHSAHGEGSLTTTCSVFPRTSLAVAGSLEVGGSLACPEVARLALLSEDGLELQPAPRPMLPRAYVGKIVPAAGDNGYARHFLPVRALLLRLFSRPDYPIASRLLFAAHFADRVAPFFRPDAAEWGGAERAFAERRLHGEIAEAEEPALLASLHSELGGIDAPGEGPLGAATTLLLGRLRLPHAPRYRALLEGALASLFEEALGRRPLRDEEVPAALVVQTYRRRSRAIETRAAGRASFVFGNWAQHFLLRHPYTDAGSLSEHLYRLALQLAAIRVLFVGQPEIAARLAASPDDAIDREVIDRAAVAAVQVFTKAIGHSPEYGEAAARAAAESGGFGFGRLLLFASFV